MMPEVQTGRSPQKESSDNPTVECQGIAGDVLLQYLERIERLEEEKSGIGEDIKEIFLEAKGNGFDVKIMRELLKLRKQEQHELDEQETMLLIYRRAIGMIH